MVVTIGSGAPQNAINGIRNAFWALGGTEQAPAR